MASAPMLAGPGRPKVPRRLLLLASAVGVGGLAGAASAGFLVTLDWATDRQSGSGWLLWFLPLGGAAVAAVGAQWGGRASQGNRLTLRQIRQYDAGVPFRMAPLVYVGTIVTHVFGGSAGREGTALQMAAGLTDGIATRTGMRPPDRRLLLVAALAAGFGSVFGVPWAGVVFALEISPLRWRHRLLVAPACIVAAFVGDEVVALLGVSHHAYPHIVGVRLRDVAVVAVVAPLFGLCSWLFTVAAEGVKHALARWVPRVWVRPVVGGAIVIALTFALGTRAYNGLSLPLLDDAFGLVEIGAGVWLAKLAMTSVTVGSGFAGGEVTPLFVMGATLGAAVGHLAGEPVVLLAAVGMMATFGSAVNASFACTVMGIELFGWGAAAPLVIGCGIARLCSTGRSLYAHEEVPEEAELV